MTPTTLAALALLAASLSGAQGRQEKSLTFEDAPTGAPPPGFSFALTGGGGPVRWVVLEDPSAPAGTRVAAETSGDRTYNRFPLAILEDFMARDVAVSVRFRPISGTVDQAAGQQAGEQEHHSRLRRAARVRWDRLRRGCDLGRWML
jgi:hypothetical protein